MAQSGGYITVDSAVGNGTVFSIYLPQCLAEQPAADDPDLEPEREESGCRILLVEDQAAVRMVVAELLESFGYEVTVTTGPEEALAVAETSAFELLLTDVVMPGMSGVELAERLQATWPDLHVLLTSGYPDGRFDGGIDSAFLQKPYSPSELRVAVRNALGAGVLALA